MFLMSQLLQGFRPEEDAYLDLLPYFLMHGVKERAFDSPSRDTVLGDLFVQGFTLHPSTGEVMDTHDVELGIQTRLEEELSRYPAFVSAILPRYAPYMKRGTIGSFLQNSYLNQFQPRSDIGHVPTII